jgi:hypothetical protein
LKVAEQIVAGWDGEEKAQLEKVWNWVHLAEDAADERTAVIAALNSWKSENREFPWDMLELVSAVGATGKSLSNIVNEAKLVKSPRGCDMTPRTRYITVQPEPMLPVRRRTVGKRSARRRKRASSGTHPQAVLVRLQKL